jgi:carboxyl-terminal processing protease
MGGRGPGKALILWALITSFFGLCIIGAGAQTVDRDRRYTSMIQNVFDFIQKHYVEEVDPKKLYEGAMSGMLGALGDPYSQFLAEKDMAELNQSVIKGSYGGVGLYISKPNTERAGNKPPFVEIASPIEGTPGWRAGLQPGDLIIKINDTTTDTLSMDDVLARLKGPAGEQVNLLIRRGTKLEFPVTLTRAIIEVPTVKQAMIGDIGYLKLIAFSSMTADRARDALEEFKKNNYKALILDLRNNYGGLLNSAVDVCNLFLEGGVVVSVKSRIVGQNSISYGGKTPIVPQTMPIVVLINHGSASASEIVAGALKDRSRAYLVGEKTYGKGSVQQVYPLEKSGFKITTARYYTPSDVNIDKVGIPPDREVLFPKFSTEDADALNKLINSNKIPAFIEANPHAAPGVMDSFARQLFNEYRLDFNLLRRLIRDEQNRTVIAPVFDLEYDVQLQEAVKILHDGVFLQLIKNTKTLRALQQDAEAEEALAS